MPKTRKNTTRKMATLCEKDHEKFYTNPKINITGSLKGKRALSKAKDLLFESKSEATRWESQWSPAEISKGSMILYTRRKRSKLVRGFRYCLGSGENESIVGHEYS